MKGQRMRVVLLAAIGWLVFGAAPAEACMCMAVAPACQATWRVEAVFVGYVRAIEPVRPADPGTTGEDRWPSDVRRVRMQVVERFRGPLPAEIDIYTGAGDMDCGFTFSRDGSYLVYASQGDDGRFRTGICSGTQRFESASTDLDYLRRLGSVTPSFGRIQGTARLRSEIRGESPTPYAGARVVATSETSRFETLTAADGSYELPVPVGTYALAVAVPEEVLAVLWPPVPEVEVRDVRGCAHADIHVSGNGRIAGRVLTARGEPVARQSVGLYEYVRMRPSSDPILQRRSTTWTDAGGVFEFHGRAAGEYLVGVEDRTATTERRLLLYPGTTDAHDATVVTLPARARVVLDDLVLTASTILARGVVRTFDGRVVPEISVVFQMLDDRGRWRGSWGTVVVSNADGRFEFAANTGVLYRIVAGPDIGPLQDEQGPIVSPLRRVELPAVQVAPDMPPIEIVLPDHD